MANIDKRVVEMKFDNAAFERGVAATMSTLDKLKSKLNFGGSAKGLNDLNAAGKKVDMSHLGRGIDAVQAKFGALQVAGVAAFATIVSKATAAGANLIKAFTIAPITQGFGEYELKMKSIQTILTNTARHGTTLATVNSELNKLNEYSDKTIYNFAEMTKNASLFTNSGMKIEDATTVIKGFSNAAAASGTGAQEAARAAYQMSQAISAGKVSAIDWISVTNAGMGGKNMQDGLIAVANGMGTFSGKTGAAELAATNFKGSLEQGWLTADVMSTYLKAMSGDMTDAELAASGLNAEQIKVLQSQAKMGLDAATKVRTLSALMGTLKESVASGWAQSFEIIFGNFEEATRLFTDINNYIGGILGRSSDARNKMLQDWKNNNGRHFLLVGLKQAALAFAAILKPIGQAFRDIFPATTGKQLADLSEAFMNFTKKLMVGKETSDNIRDTFRGLFSVISLVVQVIKGAVGALFSMVGAGAQAGGGIFAITGAIGNLVSGIVRLIEFTNVIPAFFGLFVIGFKAIGAGIGLISDLTIAIGQLLKGDVSGFTDGIKDAFSEFAGSFGFVTDIFKNFTDSVANAFEGLATMLSGMSRRLSASGNAMGAGITGGLSAVATFLAGFYTDARGTLEKIAQAFDSVSLNGKSFFKGFATNGLAGIMALIDMAREKFEQLRSALDFKADFSGFNASAGSAASGGASALSGFLDTAKSIFSGIGNFFGGVKDFLGPLLTNLGDFFNTFIVKITGYIEQMDMQDFVALLNVGAIIYFAKQVGGAFANIGGAFEQLGGSLKSLQNAARAATLIQIAIAVGLLVGAMFILAKIDANALKVALISVGVLLAQVALMMKVLTKIEPEIAFSSAAAMVAIAGAILILANAVEILGKMDPKVLVQGGLAITAMMAALAGMSVILSMTSGIIAAATGLVILSAALTLLAGVLVLYSQIPWSVVEGGLTRMGLALIALGIGMQAMPSGMVLKAAGLVILSQAMLIFAGVIALYAALPADTFESGLTRIAIALGVLIIAVNAAQGALKGAAALAIIAAALAVLIPVIAALGVLPIEVIILGIGALALTLGVIVIALHALRPVIAVLVGFGAAIHLFGLAILLAGTGFAIFVGGLVALVAIGTAGFAVLAGGIITLIALFPQIAQQAGYGFIAFIRVIADSGDAITRAFADIVVSMLKAIQKVVPEFIKTYGIIIMAFVDEVARRVPQIAQAGLNMILGVLNAIKSRVYQITTTAIDITVLFISALTARLPRIIQAGVDFIISFIKGLAEAIRGNKERTGEAGADLAKALVEGMIAGLKALGHLFPENVKALARAGLLAFKQFFGINSPSTVFAGLGRNIVEGLINGLGGMFGGWGNKVRELAKTGLTAIRALMPDWAKSGVDFVAGLIRGVATKASSLATEAKSMIRSAISAAKSMDAGEVGRAIVSGIVRGITNGISMVTNAARNLAKGALDSAKNFLGIKSPSKEFVEVGKYVDEGFAKGITDNMGKVDEAFAKLNDLVTKAMENAAKDIDTHKAKIGQLTDARTKSAEQLKDSLAVQEAARVAANKVAAANQYNYVAIDAANAKYEEAKAKVWDLTQAHNANEQAIADARAALAESTSEHDRAKASSEALATQFVSERESLGRLTVEYEDVSKRLDEANKTLDDAIKTRQSYNETISNQYGNLGDISKETTLADYMEELKAKIEANQKFAESLQALRDLGLNDQMYKKLLTEGIDAIPFVEELLTGGAAAIAEVNKTGDLLGHTAQLLGETASSELYDAGVNAAQGLVNGLQSQRNAIEREVAAIAALVAQALAEKLKIKSPSRVMMELGVFTGQGLAKGIKESSSVVKAASSDLGDDAVVALKKSMSNLSLSLDAGVDMTPVIRPVLDLTDLQKGAKSIGSLIPAQSVSVGAAYSSASAASAAYRNNQTSSSDTDTKTVTAAPTNVTFVQNNTSPKALSQSDIYRQTNNQLSRAKGALSPRVDH